MPFIPAVWCRIATILHYYSIGSAASYDLHNIPFAYKINATAQDYTIWDVFEFEFCGQVSSSLPWPKP